MALTTYTFTFDGVLDFIVETNTANNITTYRIVNSSNANVVATINQVQMDRLLNLVDSWKKLRDTISLKTVSTV